MSKLLILANKELFEENKIISEHFNKVGDYLRVLIQNDMIVEPKEAAETINLFDKALTDAITDMKSSRDKILHYLLESKSSDVKEIEQFEQDLDNRIDY